MLHKSIRWRIQLWHGALLLFLIAGMLATFFVYERAERFRVIDDQLNSVATSLLPRFAPPHEPDFGGPPRDEPDRGPNPRPRGREHSPSVDFDKGPHYYIAWSPQRDIIAQSSNAPVVPIPQRSATRDGHLTRTRGDLRELAILTPEDSGVLVGVSTLPLSAQLHRLAGELVVVGLALAAFGLAGGWFVAGHVLRPIGEISATAQRIAGGDRSTRINLEESDSELGQLAAVLNRTFDKLDHAFEQQVRFTADASHELRTPVSVILTQVQVALSRERSGAEYRETLAACQRAAERMRVLVNSLLELARLDSGEFHLNVEDCDLAKIAANALDLVTPLARQKSAILHSSIESVAIRGDSVKLSQVLVNLLQNAVEHNAPGVEVCLTIQHGDGKAFIRVSDNGVGIPEEALPQLFDRFYRVDKSRSASKGGTGLGLAISKAIVESHGGTITLESTAPSVQVDVPVGPPGVEKPTVGRSTKEKPTVGKNTAFLVVLPLTHSFTSS
jgi:heavy metal sensor kinase